MFLFGLSICSNDAKEETVDQKPGPGISRIIQRELKKIRKFAENHPKSNDESEAVEKQHRNPRPGMFQKELKRIQKFVEQNPDPSIDIEAIEKDHHNVCQDRMFFCIFWKHLFQCHGDFYSAMRYYCRASCHALHPTDGYCQ